MPTTTLVDRIMQFAAKAGDTDRVLAQGTVTALQAATAAKTAADANVSEVTVSGTNMTVTKGTGDGATSETFSVGTTYNEATTSTSGLLSSSDKAKLDGIEAGATNTPAYDNATTSAAGLMSAEDKTKLDGIAAGATNTPTYDAVTTTTAGLMSAADKVKLDGIATGATNTPAYSNATTSAAGLMSAADKAKLDGIEGIAVDTSNCVKLTGTQTIAGIKTFSPDLVYFDAEMAARFKATSSEDLSTRSLYSSTFSIRSYSNLLTTIRYGKATNNKAYLSIYCYGLGTASSTGGNGQLGLEIHPDSTEYAVQPSRDNEANLGIASRRWKQVFAGTASISTSDARTKQAIAAIPDAVLDAWEEVNWQQFQFNDAVAEKGDNARLHTGLVAQRILEVFQQHGLDATRYGLLCHDTWSDQEEERDASGNVTIEARPAGDLYSLRYTEALAMEAACQRRRADRMEARLADMEGRLAALEAK